MAGESLKFLHASDLHLERPMSGLSEIPDHLEDLLIDAPLQAATGLFETAILENVDFVLLSGDVVDPRTAGPRVLSFLLEQLELLAEQRIAVYWCAGQVDAADTWPEDVALPPNTHRFLAGELTSYAHRRGDQPVANVIGIGAAGVAVPIGEYRIEPSNLFTVALGHGEADAASLASHKQIDYWALGGRHQAKTVLQGRQTAVYPGTPQGRSPGESGPHSGVLVQLDAARKIRTKSIATDAIRWREETITLGEEAHRNDLQRSLRNGMQRVASECGNTAALVAWEVQAEGTVPAALRNEQLNRELLEWLRTEFGRAQPPIWSVSLDVASADPLPEELYEEDTILGDFLRAVRDHQEHRDRPLNLGSFLPDLGENRSLTTALQSVDAEQRESLLHAAAVLGVDLLRGEESIR
jgi:DNA repair exonuclease SbcCD nuclease subunit